MLYRLVVFTISVSETPSHYHLPSNTSSWCVNDDDIAGAAAAAAINCHSLANISHITMDNNNEIFDGEMIMNWVSAGAPCIVDLQ